MWQVGGKTAAEPVFRKTIELAEAHLRINPASHDLESLVVAYGSLGLEDEFKIAKQNVLSIWSTDPQALYSIAVGASRLGDFETTREFAKQAFEAGYPAAFLNADPDIRLAGVTF